jgi:hypothetical protein
MRNDCDEREAAKAAQKVSDRYNELSGSLGFEGASKQAKK